MATRLMVRVIMNSSCEEALDWKCCNLSGMNLELQVINSGDDKVLVRSEAELVGEAASERIDYLYPHGLHCIGPGEALSFYCFFDDERMSGFSHIEIRDAGGNKYRAQITGRREDAMSC